MNVKARLAEVGTAMNEIEGLSLIEDDPARELTAKLEQAKKDLDVAFCNSFDTPTAMQIISRLVRNGNIYMNQPGTNLRTVEVVARWVTNIVGILGLDSRAKPPYDSLGWASGGGAATTNTDPKTIVFPYALVFSTVMQEIRDFNLSESSVQALLDQQSPDSEFAELEKSGEQDPEKLALPYIRAVSRLRDGLRRAVSSLSLEPKTKSVVLKLTDRIRDYDLADLGVQLDDQLDKPSLVKFVPAAKLAAAREEKAALIAEKARQKEQGMYLSLHEPGRMHAKRTDLPYLVCSICFNTPFDQVMLTFLS